MVFTPLLLGAASCGPPEPTVILHPGSDPAARQTFSIAFSQRITLPDNFVLRPDEFAAVLPDAARQVLYVGSRDGSLLALDQASGKIVWEVPLGGAVSSELVLTTLPEPDAAPNGILLVGTDNGELAAVDVASRRVRWRYRTDGKIRAAPVVVEGVVYFVNSRDQLYALDVRTGDWRWQYEQELQTDFTVNGHAGLTYVPNVVTPGAPSEDAPAPASAGGDEPGTIYTGFDNGKVVAIGAASGEALWIASVAPADGGDFVDCDSTPLHDPERGVVVVAGQSTGVHALAASSGALVWKFPIRAAGTLVRGRADDLLGASSLEGVFSLDVHGVQRWRTQIDAGVVSVPVLVDDAVYVTHSERGLLVFDAETGEYLASIDLGSGMSSVPVFDPLARRFYATTNRGLLLALDIHGEGPRGPFPVPAEP